MKQSEIYTLSKYLQHKFFLLKEKHERSIALFDDSITENNEEKKALVIEAIQNDDWEKQNALSFKTALNKSIYPEMLTNYSLSELNSMKLYKLNGYDIGYAIKKKDGKYCEIVSVFNNEQDVRNIGDYLIQSAIKHGGEYLDHYDGKLIDFYSSNGFVEYHRDKFDPSYDEDGSFRAKYGEPDIIYRKLKK